MDRRRVLSFIKTAITGFDKPLALIVFLLFATGIVALYSAAIDMPGRVEDQLRNILLSYVVMWVIAYLPTQTLMRVAVPLYTVGVALLVAVAMFGLIRKGARRWLYVGMVIQPSEIMKIAMPLMLAWYFQKREELGQVVRFRAGAGAAARARRPDRQAARPWHRSAGDGRWSLCDLFRRPVVEDHPAAASHRGGGHHRAGQLRARYLRPWRELADPARLPAAPHLHAARSHHRPARQGFPHHPVHYRHRLRRRVFGKGWLKGTQAAPGVHPGKAHRLYLPRSSRRNSAWWAMRCCWCCTCC
ncbi:FtsW/RodA/SpoVE family cell cycle protein [Cupriavidus basilensis]